MKSKMWQQILLVALMVVSTGLGGCESLKAGPSKGAGFVPMDEMSKREDLPFQKVWSKPGVDWNSYKALFIKEVNTQYLLEANWWQENFRRENMERDAKEVAQYMQQQFKEAFRNDPKHCFRIVETPEPHSLTFEIALTELVPSNVVLEAMGFAPFGIGTGVKVMEKATGAVSTVAFEARIIDTDTGTVLAMFADREQQKINPINLKGLTWYAEAHSIINDWAGQCVQVANKQPGEVIKASSPFSLKPW